MSERRHMRKRCLEFGLALVAMILGAPWAAAGNRSHPELSDPLEDTTDEITGQPESGPTVSNVDLVGVWFKSESSDEFTIHIRPRDLSDPPVFRTGRTVHSYDVIFFANGDDFRASVSRDVLGATFGFLRAQNGSNADAPRSDRGTASVRFGASDDTIQLVLPRAWGPVNFDDGTEIGTLRSFTYDGQGDAQGCVCSILDRGEGSESFVFGPGGNGGSG